MSCLSLSRLRGQMRWQSIRAENERQPQRRGGGREFMTEKRKKKRISDNEGVGGLKKRDEDTNHCIYLYSCGGIDAFLGSTEHHSNEMQTLK